METLMAEPGAKKTAVRKPAAKKATARKPAAKKAAGTVRKAAAKKVLKKVARKPVAKKAAAPAKKAAAKKPARKTVVKKAASTARKSVARKAVPAKKAAAKTPARKTVAKKPAAARKAVAKKAVTRAAPRKANGAEDCRKGRASAARHCKRLKEESSPYPAPGASAPRGFFVVSVACAARLPTRVTPCKIRYAHVRWLVLTEIASIFFHDVAASHRVGRATAAGARGTRRL